MTTRLFLLLTVAGMVSGWGVAQEPVRSGVGESVKKNVPMNSDPGGAKAQVDKGDPLSGDKAKGKGDSAKETKAKGPGLANLPHRNKEKELTRFGVISNRGGGAGDPLDPGLASWNDRKPANCAPGCDCRNERFGKGPVENKTRPREIPKAGGK